MPRFVTVFGGASPTEPDYNAALRLGKLLGQAGCSVLTGGYIGTMEAVSRGAAESGGHVIGVTCEEIEAWRKVSPQPLDTGRAPFRQPARAPVRPDRRLPGCDCLARRPWYAGRNCCNVESSAHRCDFTAPIDFGWSWLAGNIQAVFPARLTRTFPSGNASG